MPTRKQRKRLQKERRHEYETVWVDSEGNELEEPPDDAPAVARERHPDGKPKAQQKGPQRRPNRADRTPLPPSWRRSVRRSLILGAVIFVASALFLSKDGKHNYLGGLVFAVLYTGVFIPFTYYLDRFAYGRWLRKTSGQAKKR